MCLHRKGGIGIKRRNVSTSRILSNSKGQEPRYKECEVQSVKEDGNLKNE